MNKWFPSQNLTQLLHRAPMVNFRTVDSIQSERVQDAVHSVNVERKQFYVEIPLALAGLRLPSEDDWKFYEGTKLRAIIIISQWREQALSNAVLVLVLVVFSFVWFGQFTKVLLRGVIRT